MLNNKPTNEQRRANELGLSPNKTINVQMPTPSQLANKINHETYPLTFRVDEVAYAYIDLLVKKYDISLNGFMNELVNSFIAQNTLDRPSEYILNHAVNMHMSRLLNKMLRLSEGEIIETFHTQTINGILDFFAVKLPSQKKDKAQFYQNFYHGLFERGHNQLCAAFAQYFNICLWMTADGNKASVLNTEKLPETEQNNFFWQDFVLYVPVSKWVIVTTILQEYENKCKRILGNEWPTYREMGDLENIAGLINQYGGKTLAEYLVAQLRLGENFTEKTHAHND